MKTAEEKINRIKQLVDDYSISPSKDEIWNICNDLIKSLSAPTVTDEEIERMAKEEHKFNHKSVNEISFRLGFFEGFKAARSRLSQPVGECRCHLQSQQTMCNWECIKKLIAENQPVTGYSEEFKFPDEDEAQQIMLTSKNKLMITTAFQVGFMECYKWLKSLKSKPNTNTEE